MSINFIADLKSKIMDFKTEKTGVAAVEFALILPIMLLIYVGVVEVTRIYAADRKAVVFAHTVADLATQAKVDTAGSGFHSISDGDASLIFGLASSVLYPFSASGADIKLTMLAFDSTVPAAGPATGFVDWEDVCTVQTDGISCAYGTGPLLGSASSRCTTQSVDEGFAKKNGYTIRAQVAFQYMPLLPSLFGFIPATGITLQKDTLHMQPRNDTVVIRTRSSGGIPTTNSPLVASACSPSGTPGGSFIP